MFQSAVDEYGLPSRIRTDRGGENVLVSHFMIEHPLRGTGRGSVIPGILSEEEIGIQPDVAKEDVMLQVICARCRAGLMVSDHLLAL